MKLRSSTALAAATLFLAAAASPALAQETNSATDSDCAVGTNECVQNPNPGAGANENQLDSNDAVDQPSTADQDGQGGATNNAPGTNNDGTGTGGTGTGGDSGGASN